MHMRLTAWGYSTFFQRYPELSSRNIHTHTHTQMLLALPESIQRKVRNFSHNRKSIVSTPGVAHHCRRSVAQCRSCCKTHNSHLIECFSFNLFIHLLRPSVPKQTTAKKKKKKYQTKKPSCCKRNPPAVSGHMDIQSHASASPRIHLSVFGGALLLPWHVWQRLASARLENYTNVRVKRYNWGWQKGCLGDV